MSDDSLFHAMNVLAGKYYGKFIVGNTWVDRDVCNTAWAGQRNFQVYIWLLLYSEGNSFYNFLCSDHLNSLCLSTALSKLKQKLIMRINTHVSWVLPREAFRQFYKLGNII